MAAAAATVFLLSGAAASAAAPAYPTVGKVNKTTYEFTASTTGDLIGYFAGSTAGYTETIGLMVNGVMPTTFGLNDHTSTLGEAFDFGHVTKGDSLVFVLNTQENAHHFAFSDPSLNAPYDFNTVGSNHVYSTHYDGQGLGGGIPAGTYVAFEDLTPWWTDFNYHDDTFVFADTRTVATRSAVAGGVVGTVPESGTWAMMIVGLGLMGAELRRQRARRLRAA